MYMLKHLMMIGLAAAMTTAALAQKAPVELEVWPEGAPHDSGLTGVETVMGNGSVSNVTHPMIYIYPAENPNGIVILSCPGGGYLHLSIYHEGIDMAPWLNSLGITLAVLKYRMPNGHMEVPTEDIQQAILLMRRYAPQWGGDPGKVGVMGASAGGHLAAYAATHFTASGLTHDRRARTTSDRPDFQILFYPPRRIADKTIGEQPTQNQIDWYDNVKHVSAQTPPAFILCSADDRRLPGSIEYFQALNAKGVPAALHIYPTGGHGWGFNDSFPYKAAWTAELEQWLQLLFQ